MECQHRGVLRPEKPFARHPVDHLSQRVEIAVCIQETAWLMVNAELGPGPLLENLFQRASAAGQGNKSIRQLGHFRLTLMMVATMWSSESPVC